MLSILVVCTGNICRSPIAHGFLTAAIDRRFPEPWITVTSAGTWASAGNPAMPDSVRAAEEWGVDIASHRATRLTPEGIGEAALVVGLANEHREETLQAVPEAASKTFTLKEVVRLLEALPASQSHDEETFHARVAEVRRLRDERPELANTHDEDVVDPLGLGWDTYRAVAWEIDDLVRRMADGFFGPEAASDDEQVEASG